MSNNLNRLTYMVVIAQPLHEPARVVRRPIKVPAVAGGVALDPHDQRVGSARIGLHIRHGSFGRIASQVARLAQYAPCEYGNGWRLSTSTSVARPGKSFAAI
jgi:hypothetical protein